MGRHNTLVDPNANPDPDAIHGNYMAGIITDRERDEKLERVRTRLFGPNGGNREQAIAAVIERLREADRADKGIRRDRAIHLGAEWAKSSARPDQLRRLESLSQDQDGLDGTSPCTSTA
jgi:hypothetical protein